MFESTDKDCYVVIKGHEREIGHILVSLVRPLLSKYVTEEVKYGYNPDTVMVFFSPTMPAKDADKLLTLVEEKLKYEYPKIKWEVSIEIP